MRRRTLATTQRMSGVVLLLSALVAATMSGGAAADPQAGPALYLNPRAPIPARVEDLLRRMTLAEKIGQMDQIVTGALRDNVNPPDGNCDNSGGNNDPLQPNCLENVLIKNFTGSILAGGTDNPVSNTGRGWAEWYNTIQRHAIERSRLHIPVIFGVDAVHGFGHPFEAPLFPHSIGIGATWDPAAARAGGEVTARALAATGWTWNFAPVQDLHRDNRWGRTYETWAEQPALAAALGAAYVSGLQGSGRDGLRAAATVKHFAGYSQSINGHDRVEEQLPIRYLQDVFLPSYAGGIDANAATVMVNSGSINNVPATASHFLLTTLLRERMGFKGVVISDFGDVGALASAYHIAPDFPGAIAKAVNAGIDVSMTPFDYAGWQAGLAQKVREGVVSEERINQSVRRILRLKFELGLFEHPFVDESRADAAVKAGRDATLRAAQQSITLLRNQNNLLPLPAGAKLVVTGPSADSMTNQLGGWSVSWQGVFGAGHVCCMGPPDQIPPGTTVLKGLQAATPNVVHAPDQASAVAAAPGADAIVVAVGEKAYAEGLGDNPAPQLPADQKALIAALQATGKPVIVVVIAGRPLGLGPGRDAAGLLMAYQGSTEAGAAVADVIFGRVNPSGRLPVSWPSEADAPGGDFCGNCPSPIGDQPKFFDQLPSTASGQGNAYNPLFPFGFGLSYTTFETSNLSVAGTVGRNGTVDVSVTVRNTGSRAGTQVVPVYVRQPVSRIVVPPQRLVAFTRVTLDPGQSQTVRMSFPVSTLAVTGGDIDATGPRQVEPGSYQAVVENLTAGFTVR
ncbi:MAG TPA: glycoside hydrolase family 3 N-terminal domain-containing protein [Actinophytocola sp.]|uniref:glycoside hydrolase family 3 N-terminal domain-containing protein n=1 Tax=Actinophytocola sp. TaxID=1872138 RepID=UPI002DDD48A2|nr:glycoside hydrolase family 3 N-terminal domain-containing protein [Actinophytocola sp.]HEV2783363.1 glycoside hydrolase family 3 N-terminal domain-containing protein [Actinophytocola sp.]